MNTYVMMKAPKEEDHYSSEIRIIDNSGPIGKKKVESLAEDGWEYVGRIETELRVQELVSGFEHELRKRLEAGQELLWNIRKMTEEYI